MEGKLTPEVYSQKLEKAILTGEVTEHIWSGVENITENDKLLLFLVQDNDEGKNEYIITGTSYFGKFNYDEQNQSFYRIKNNNGNGNIVNKRDKTQKELQISLEDLTKKVKETKDNSKKMKEDLEKSKEKRKNEPKQKSSENIEYEKYHDEIPTEYLKYKE